MKERRNATMVEPDVAYSDFTDLVNGRMSSTLLNTLCRDHEELFARLRQACQKDSAHLSDSTLLQLWTTGMTCSDAFPYCNASASKYELAIKYGVAEGWVQILRGVCGDSCGFCEQKHGAVIDEVAMAPEAAGHRRLATTAIVADGPVAPPRDPPTDPTGGGDGAQPTPGSRQPRPQPPPASPPRSPLGAQSQPLSQSQATALPGAASGRATEVAGRGEEQGPTPAQDAPAQQCPQVSTGPLGQAPEQHAALVETLQRRVNSLERVVWVLCCVVLGLAALVCCRR